MGKEIIIIDAFITNYINEQKLIRFIERIKLTNIPILLISNSVIKSEIINEVDYFIYDSNNRLFDDVFDSYEKFILWEIIDGVKFNTYHYHKQKHALSVMVNLFTSLTFIKSLGFEYFHRIEYDTILGDKTIDVIKNINNSVCSEDKKGYFILNHNSKTHTFQYFFSEISFFEEFIPKIREQQDYVDFIKHFYNENKFISVEKLMFDLLYNKECIKIVERDRFEFGDTIWNTVSSDIHLEENQKNCRTSFYKGVNNNIILSKNNINSEVSRKIILYVDDINSGELHHNLNQLYEKQIDYINKDVNKIEIIENEKLIEVIHTNSTENYFEI